MIANANVTTAVVTDNQVKCDCGECHTICLVETVSCRQVTERIEHEV